MCSSPPAPHILQLQIWDTAGMEQFRNALITKYYRNADGKNATLLLSEILDALTVQIVATVRTVCLYMFFPPVNNWTPVIVFGVELDLN